MSRFFRGNDSDSSSSEEEEELYSEEEEDKEEADSDEDESDEDDEDDSDDSSDDEGATGADKFLKSDDEEEDSSEEEDKVTVVKSAKDKKFEELEGTVRLIENAEKIGDWAVISTEYDKLNRQLPTVLKNNDGKPPKIYIKTVADLEILMVETHEKQKVTPKKMNALSSKGLNAVRQKIRKLNKEYQTDIDAYRDDKEGFMIEDSIDETPKSTDRQSRRQADSSGPITSTADGDDEGWEGVGRDGRPMRYTPESILKHLRAIVESRGRKNTDRLEQIRVMERLLDVANTDYQRLRVYMSLISTRFDLTSGTTNYMSSEQWTLANTEYQKMLELLSSNKNIVVVEGAEEWEDDERQPTIDGTSLFQVPGSITSLAERLDDELTRSLQHIDPHTAEYIERLSDETALYTNVKRSQLYAEKILANPELSERKSQATDNLNRIVMRRLEHVYFKPAAVVAILEANSWAAIDNPPADSTITPRADPALADAAGLIKALSSHLYANSEGILRGRAMLAQIYHLALSEQYHAARDMLLMSHLQDTIGSFDVATQILFNRTLVQVGLCAFRAGLVYEAQGTLQEICGSGRQKELLAQGVQMTRYSQVSPEQERLERQRQLPFHMHINLELLECVYLTSSMLLEIPLLAQTGSSPDVRRRVISKTFRRMLEYHERQVFTGPPENTRDHVMAASKALAAGEWRKSADLISDIKIWDLIKDPAGIKVMLERLIQEEGLRTYLFTYAPFYDTLSLERLGAMFDLPPKKVSAIVARMISHEELAAALDQVSQSVVFDKGVEVSRLQSLALALSDKASGLIEGNERTLEQRTQGSSGGGDREGGGGGGRGGGGPRGRGGARGGRVFRGGAGGYRRGGGFQGGVLGGAFKA